MMQGYDPTVAYWMLAIGVAVLMVGAAVWNREDKCPVCDDTGMTGWGKPMNGGRSIVFVPQLCNCPAGRRRLREHEQ